MKKKTRIRKAYLVLSISFEESEMFVGELLFRARSKTKLLDWLATDGWNKNYMAFEQIAGKLDRPIMVRFATI